jgi:cellulose biosynthesis protein BcsQ
VGDIGEPFVEEVEEKIGLLPGDLDLSGFEDELAAQWTGCLDRKERSFRVVSALSRLIQAAGRRFQADLALMDLGPNLGAINRAALIAADWVAVPLAPDLYSVMGLKNLGPALIKWRREWAERLDKKPKEELELPAGSMRPVGYIILQHSEYSNKPVKAYQKWIGRIPNAYQEYILEARPDPAVKVTGDPNALSLIKHYRSLMAQAHEARKPVFMLRSADGVIGAHHQNVAAAYNDFKELARIIANRIGLDWNG